MNDTNRITSDKLTVGQQFECSHGYNRYTKCGGGPATVTDIDPGNVRAVCRCDWAFYTPRSAQISVLLSVGSAA